MQKILKIAKHVPLLYLFCVFHLFKYLITLNQMHQLTPEEGLIACNRSLKSFSRSLRKIRKDKDLALRLDQLVDSENPTAALKAIEMQLKLRGLLEEKIRNQVEGVLKIQWANDDSDNSLQPESRSKGDAPGD